MNRKTPRSLTAHQTRPHSRLGTDPTVSYQSQNLLSVRQRRLSLLSFALYVQRYPENFVTTHLRCIYVFCAARTFT